MIQAVIQALESKPDGISVVIPIGPSEANKAWLDECVRSIHQQTMPATQYVFIMDGSGLTGRDMQAAYNAAAQANFRTWQCPWRTGISHAFNYGVMLADTDCVFLLGSDDTLEPDCLARCWEAYLKRDRQDAYYSVPVRYMATGEVQTIPCNAAMVTKGFWRLTGGFPIESAIGRGDNALLSICMNRPELPVVWVGHETGHDQEPLYNYRQHEGQWTPYASSYSEELISIINKLTANWVPPTWTDKYA